MLQQRAQDVGGQGRMHPRGCGDRDSQCWALHDRPRDHRGDDLSGFVTANFGKGAKRSRLFRHDAVRAESRKTPAQRREGGDGCSELPPPGFCGEQGAVAEARFRDRGDQCRVVLVDCGNGLSRASRRGRFRPRGGIGEQIELMSGHSTMMPRTDGLSKSGPTEAVGARAAHRGTAPLSDEGVDRRSGKLVCADAMGYPRRDRHNGFGEQY